MHTTRVQRSATKRRRVEASANSSIVEFGSGLASFEAEIDRTLSRPRPMTRTGGHAIGLTRPKNDDASVQIDLETPLDHDEEFVGIGMPMPAVLAFEHRDAEAMIVDRREFEIVVAVEAAGRGGEIDGREFSLLGDVER